MLDRLRRWLSWAVVISLLPYAGLALLRFRATQQWPTWVDALGAGQLLLTSIALLAGGARELSGMSGDQRTKTRDFLLFSTVALCIVLSIVYGSAASDVIAGAQVSPDEMMATVLISAVSFGASCVITGAAVITATPSKAG